MIAKRIARRSRDNYGRLAKYIAGAPDAGEKLDHLWIAGCDAGETFEDLDLAIAEIEATQNLNRRAKSDKTYHLIVSFRKDKPTLAQLKDIEEHFAEALGYAEHQRIVATHTNTENFHMHVAYNKIHPTKLTINTPLQDFRKLHIVCRAMEKKHGISVDPGMEEEVSARDQAARKKVDREKVNQAAKDFEAHTWEQSFDGYVKERKEDLLAARDAAAEEHGTSGRGWQVLHAAFGAHDLELKLRGNGLVIKNRKGREAMKASTLHRSFSKAALEKDLGPYQAPEKPKKRKKHSYKRQPLYTHPQQNALWNQYTRHHRRRRRPGLVQWAAGSWKDFLMAEAVTDPMAMTIILYNRAMLETFIGPTKNYGTVEVKPAPQHKVHRGNEPAKPPRSDAAEHSRQR